MTKWGVWEDTYQPQVRVKLTFGARCLCCRWFTGAGRCEAFPRGIPVQILTKEHDHTKPYPGDGGYLWQSILHSVKEVTDGGHSLQGDAEGPEIEDQPP